MTEQLGKCSRWVHIGRKARAWIKKATSRHKRREARDYADEDGEHKPLHNKYHGWAD